MNKDKDFLGTEPVGKLMFRLALPTITAQLINMLYNIIDRIYIGHIPGNGALALTGVGVCMPLIMIISAFAALVGGGGAPHASIAMGKNDLNTAEHILGNCFFLQILISIILTVILLFGNRTLSLHSIWVSEVLRLPQFCHRQSPASGFFLSFAEKRRSCTSGKRISS